MGTLGNLIGGRLHAEGLPYEVTSPVTGEPFQCVSLASRGDVAAALQGIGVSPRPVTALEVFEFLRRLKTQLIAHKDRLFETTYLETGFIGQDSLETVESAVEFLDEFETYVSTELPTEEILRHSYSSRSNRAMRIARRPFRCIAAIVPQNASLSLGIIIIASALYAGSRVILRPSLQCAATGSLLAELVLRAAPPASCIQIVNCLASEFLEACYASSGVDLIHYIGSNQHALSVFTRSFSAGKTCLVDGQGNGLLYLDDTIPVDEAVKIITSGATRFNGQTCTSINGVLVGETVYEAVKAALVESFTKLRLGNPLDSGAQVGPLFSTKQAEGLQATIRRSPQAKVLCGGEVQGAYFRPAILEGVGAHDPIATEGFSGPALWLHSVRDGDQWEWFRRNRFPLSDTILSRRVERIRDLATHSRAARICVNEDPSVESMFEPWGGYPPSGVNPVSRWIEKYRQTFQFDGQLREIMAIQTDVDRQAA